MHRSRGRRAQATHARRRTAKTEAEAAGKRAPSASSLRQLMVTPTFAVSVTIVTLAVFAFGTTQTYLRFSSSGPSSGGCAAAGCASPDSSHAVGGRALGGAIRAGASRGGGKPSPSPGGAVSGPLQHAHPRTQVHVSYSTIHSIPGGFLAEISITARSGSPDRNWRLSVSYPGVQITWMAGAAWRANGDTVVIEPVEGTPQLRKGTTVPVMFTANGQAGAPSGCVFDGARCHVAG